MNFPAELRVHRFQIELRGCGAQATYVFYRRGTVAGQLPVYSLPYRASKATIIALLAEFAQTL